MSSRNVSLWSSSNASISYASMPQVTTLKLLQLSWRGFCNAWSGLSAQNHELQVPRARATMMPCSLIWWVARHRRRETSDGRNVCFRRQRLSRRPSRNGMNSIGESQSRGPSSWQEYALLDSDVLCRRDLMSRCVKVRFRRERHDGPHSIPMRTINTLFVAQHSRHVTMLMHPSPPASVWLSRSPLVPS